MIYPKLLCDSIKLNVEKTCEHGITSYTAKDGTLTVGHVDLKDIKNGAYVLFMENEKPEYYSHFGKFADMLCVNHCMKTHPDSFEIVSEASLNSHVQHFKRGKRFFDDKINEFIQNLIKSNPNGTKFDTRFLGNAKMFMPKELINKYISLIKENPLI